MQKFTPEISVVIPAYNAEKFIVHCVSSLIAQTVKDKTEIIIVDDMSSDNTFGLCRELYGDREDFIIARQEVNQGPGMARNTGIRLAHGKYITFVDADDALVPDALERLLAHAERTEADVVHTGGVLIPLAKPMPENLAAIAPSNLLRIMLDMKDSVPDDLRSRSEEWLKHFLHWNVWSKLFRRDFLIENSIEFSSLSLAEDQMFIMSCLMHAKKYVTVREFVYIYRIETQTLSRKAPSVSYLALLIRNMLAISQACRDSLKGIPFFEENRDWFDRFSEFAVREIERARIIPAYQRLRREGQNLRNNQEIAEVFSSFFGADAWYVADMFFRCYDSLPEAEDTESLFNTYAFWKAKADQAGMDSVVSVWE